MPVVATGVRDLRDNRDKGPFFVLTNWTSDVDIDCNSATNDELSDLIGTLIKVLIERGILNGTINSGT